MVIIAAYDLEFCKCARQLQTVKYYTDFVRAVDGFWQGLHGIGEEGCKNFGVHAKTVAIGCGRG